jgi:histidine triad (HIT) family protein
VAENDCIFCRIINRELPSDIVYEDEDVLVFPDISPAAPVHLLVITRKHIPSLAEMDEADTPLVGKMVKVANRIAKDRGLDSGYRLTVNSGPDGGQLVPHLHLHLLGGRKLRWEN